MREGVAEPTGVVPGVPVEAEPVGRVGDQGIDTRRREEREELDGIALVERDLVVGVAGCG